MLVLSSNDGPCGRDGGKALTRAGSEALAGVLAPGACGIEFDVALPMPARLAESAQLLKYDGEIIVGVGMLRVEAHRDLQVISGSAELPGLVEQAAEIEMRQGVAGFEFDGAPEAVGRLIEIRLFVIQSPQVDERVGAARVCGQYALVGVGGFRKRLGFGLVLKRQDKPIVGAALGHDAELFAQLAGF